MTTRAPSRIKRNEIHGEYSCYTSRKCRCPKCMTGASRYAKNRTLSQATGRWQPWSDAQPVREHVEKLRASGIGIEAISVMAGVADTTVSGVIYDGRDRVRTRVAEKILAVQPSLDALPDRVKVDSTGTRRRIQALIVIGWTPNSIASRLGFERQTIRKILNGTLVRASTARAVRVLYDQLWDTFPPNEARYERASVSRARNFAAAQGWVSALAWDEHTIDDPKAKPKGVRAVDA